MTSFEEVVAEIGTLRMLLDAIPEENCIDRASLQARMHTVLQKAIIDAAKEATKIITTPPRGFSNESEERGLWWTVDAERAIETLVRLVELAAENGVKL